MLARGSRGAAVCGGVVLARGSRGAAVFGEGDGDTGELAEGCCCAAVCGGGRVGGAATTGGQESGDVPSREGADA